MAGDYDYEIRSLERKIEILEDDKRSLEARIETLEAEMARVKELLNHVPIELPSRDALVAAWRKVDIFAKLGEPLAWLYPTKGKARG